MKIWIMCYLNLCSVLNKILLDFLQFAKNFEHSISNRTKENGTVQKIMC